MIRPVAAAALALLLMQLTSCAGGTVGVTAGSYWGGPVYTYDMGFFGPPVIYGGWGPGYFVAPPRWGARGPPPRFRGGVPARSFRPAPAGRPMPSIPAGPRGGGMRGSTVRHR